MTARGIASTRKSQTRRTSRLPCTSRWTASQHGIAGITSPGGDELAVGDLVVGAQPVRSNIGVFNCASSSAMWRDRFVRAATRSASQDEPAFRCWHHHRSHDVTGAALLDTVERLARELGLGPLPHTPLDEALRATLSRGRGRGRPA